MATRSLLEVKGLSCSRDGDSPVFANLSFTLEEGDVVVLQGKSGSGKTTLLRCLAHLNLYDGEILFEGQSPQSYGYPLYRTHVLYVPQRASLLPGTPSDFVRTLQTFRTQGQRQSQERSKGSMIDRGECIGIAGRLGLDGDLWERDWTGLSGGEAQRFAFAIALGMRSTVLLLDEPTSALDPESSYLIEKLLVDDLANPSSPLQAVVLVTHSEEQGRRLGNRLFHITAGGCSEVLQGDI